MRRENMGWEWWSHMGRNWQMDWGNATGSL
jgi:hypothetical protein